MTAALIGMRVTETGELRPLTPADVEAFEAAFEHHRTLPRTVFRREEGSP